MGKSNPNIILILNDDMGYSDILPYGGEIDTKNLDSLAKNGLRFTQFCNTARCCPSRASLLTGLHPHQSGVGHMVNDRGPEEYSGRLNKKCMTIAEVLKGSGYSTYMSGKWHICRKADIINNDQVAWPKQRGFDGVYGFLPGAGSYYWPHGVVRDNAFIDDEIKNDSDYYITDAISDNAVEFLKKHTASEDTKDNPFFMYVAYTAPHWPLHARQEDIEKYKGKFDEGWDILREKRLERMTNMGIIEEKWGLSERDPTQPEWNAVEESKKEWQTRRMETYAAQIDVMDQGIGRIIDLLKEKEIYEDTLIIFLADNGGCAEVVRESAGKRVAGRLSGQVTTKDETKDVKFGNNSEIMPGSEDTYQSYGVAWANLSNTPFRMYKQWVHEGGIATPFIVSWPKGISDSEKGTLRHTPGFLPDVMATIVDIVGANYPSEFKGNPIRPLEGQSLKNAFKKDDEKLKDRELFFEHQGHKAMKKGKWKLVREYTFNWELYDLENDRIEMNNLINKEKTIAQSMISSYESWAKRIGVRDLFDLHLYKKSMWKNLIPFKKLVQKKFEKNQNKSNAWQKVIQKRMC